MAMPNIVWSVEMHNVLKIALVVRRQPLTITLSVEGYTNLKNTAFLLHARGEMMNCQ